MKRMVWRIVIVCLAAGLIGCATMAKPTQEQINSADYGSYPENYQNVAELAIKRSLIDPNSAMFSGWRGPRKGYTYDTNGAYFGYMVCVEVNAKNRMGGYTGNQPYFLIIKNDRAIKMNGGYRYGTMGAQMVMQSCSF